MAVWSREFPGASGKPHNKLLAQSAWHNNSLETIRFASKQTFSVFCQGHMRFCSASAAVPVPQIIMHDKYFTKVKTIPVPRTVPVPVPPPPQKVCTVKLWGLKNGRCIKRLFKELLKLVPRNDFVVLRIISSGCFFFPPPSEAGVARLVVGCKSSPGDSTYSLCA